jgi:hypothetical protein
MAVPHRRVPDQRDDGQRAMREDPGGAACGLVQGGGAGTSLALSQVPCTSLTTNASCLPERSV